jgi:hypothetical protein
MGYGAVSLFMIVNPERFGREPMPKEEMIKAADRASRELKKMFHKKPLQVWQAQRGKSSNIFYTVYRRGAMLRRCDDT